MATERLRRRHHLISKFYLKRFANSDEQVRRIVLPGVQVHLTSLNDAAVQKDFYNLKLGDGRVTDFFEKEFDKIESAASAALSRLLANDYQHPLNPGDREALAAGSAFST